MEGKTIEHEGIVTGITGSKVTVSIVSQSACAACHAKGICGASEMKEKTIVAEAPASPLNVGDRVRVTATMSGAMLSVTLAYILPSALIIIALFLLLAAGCTEVTAALGALGLTAVYFFILYLCKNIFARRIKFKIKDWSE